MSYEKKPDPLVEIVQRHLTQTDSIDQKKGFLETLEHTIIAEYMKHLSQEHIHIPVRFKEGFIEDVRTEIREYIRQKSVMGFQTATQAPCEPKARK